MPRPSLVDEQTQRAAVERWRKGESAHQICGELGIGKSLLGGWYVKFYGHSKSDRRPCQPKPPVEVVAEKPVKREFPPNRLPPDYSVRVIRADGTQYIEDKWACGTFRNKRKEEE